MENLNLKLFEGEKFHFIGIGGISMSALALMLKYNGFYVQGSDEVNNSEVQKLIKKGVNVFIGHSENNIKDCGVVVVSSAIHDDNPELKFAIDNNLKIIKRAELLGAISNLYKIVIAVAGSHGKTTTTALISEIFISAGLNPTVHIGGVLNSINSNLKIGGKKYFITENCEYMDNFLNIKPDVSVILNIDSDHLDYFGDLDGVKNSFYRYATGTKEGGINLICDLDENSDDLYNLQNSVKFGIDKHSDIYAKNIKEYKSGFYSFDVMFSGCCLGEIKLNIVGKHNVLNALASVFVGLVCGVDFCDIKKSVEEFSGVKRRCEVVGEVNGAIVFHDYAHHPKQIEKMIDVALSCKNKTNGRVIVVFEPHTFSRTKYLLEEFARSFSRCDKLILAPVYSARENESAGATSSELLFKTAQFVNDIEILETYPKIAKRIKEISKQGDVVMILGAGTIENLSNIVTG